MSLFQAGSVIAIILLGLTVTRLAQGAETVTAYGNPNCNGGATGHETVLNGEDACDENLLDSFSLTVDQIDDGCYVETYTSGNCGAGLQDFINTAGRHPNLRQFHSTFLDCTFQFTAWKDATFQAPVKKADLPAASLSECQKAVQELKSDRSRADKNCFTNPSPIKSGPYNGNKATVAVSSGKCAIQLVTSTAKPTGNQLTCSKTADIANATITRLISAQKGVLMTGGLATASDNSYWVAVTTCDGPLAPCTVSKAAPANPPPAVPATNSAGETPYGTEGTLEG